MKQETAVKWLPMIVVLLLSPFLLGLSGLTIVTNTPNGTKGQVVIEGRGGEDLDFILEPGARPIKRLIGADNEKVKARFGQDQNGRFFRVTLPFDLDGQSLKKREGVFYVNYSFTRKLDLGYRNLFPKSRRFEAQKILAPATVHYEVNLPGRIVQAGTDQVFGGRAVWNLKFGEEALLKARSQTIRWRLIALTALAALVAAGVIGAFAINRIASASISKDQS